MIIGITGNFGSGKTTVSNMFRKHGFEVINADKLYHGIYNKNKVLRNKIKKEFGTLNRNEIKKIVFNDYKKLKKLNFYPLIFIFLYFLYYLDYFWMGYFIEFF